MLLAATAETALMVAIASATVALTSLVWQLTLYRLSGARLIVRLVPAVLTEVGHIIRGPAKGWRSPLPGAMDIAQTGAWVDAAVIEIVNVGRSPISLSTINLDIGADPRWKPWRRHTVGLPPIAVHGGLTETDVVRLKAAQSVFVVHDFWPAVEVGRKMRRRVLVRASVLPAGRRAKRSPWRHRWTVDSNQQHMWPFGPEGERVQLFQAVWREVAPIAPDAVYEAWLSIMGLLQPEDVEPKDMKLQEVSEALEPILGTPIKAMWPSIRILNALHKYGRAGAWTPRLEDNEPKGPKGPAVGGDDPGCQRP